MKKINWSDIIMIVLICAMTLFGVTQMDLTWCEEKCAAIWIFGEGSIVLIYLVNKLIRFIERNIDLFKD